MIFPAKFQLYEINYSNLKMQYIKRKAITKQTKKENWHQKNVYQNNNMN